MKFNLKTSMHYHVKGQTLDYYPSDTKEAQEAAGNIAWDDIEYRFNDKGFRCDTNMKDFKDDVNIFLGCSNTLGIGVNLEDTWCWHVNYRHGGTMLNMGQGDGSAETCYRLLQYWIKVIKPKAVFMLSPPATRREFWLTKDRPEIFGPRSTMPSKIMAEREIQINRERMVDAIDNVCRTYSDTRFEYVYFRPIFNSWNKKFMDHARDGQHPGIQTHVEISRHFSTT